MRVRVILFVLVVTSAAFAGCTTDEGDNGGGSTTTTTTTEPTTTTTTNGTTTTTTTGTTTSQTPDQENNAPGAVLSYAPGSGAAPLDVQFDLDGQDPDGDALTWTLDVDSDGTSESDGTELPARYNHTFVAGTYNVTFVVSDGVLEDVRNGTIEVSANGTGGEPMVVQEATGGFASGAGAGCSPVGGFFNDLDGTFDHFSFTPDPATYELPYEAVFDFTSADPSLVDLKVQFWQGGNSVLQEDVATGGSVQGTVPDGTDNVIVTACGPGAEFSVVYTVTDS